MKLMVFDVGGTEIKYSVMDESLTRTDSGYVPTPMITLDDFIQTLAGIYAPHKKEVEGIAVSLPGFIDVENGVVRGGGALLYNCGQPVGSLLSTACGGCRVVLENDGKAAAVAELARGSLRGCRNASVFIIGTGVGGGLIVDGKVVRGRDCTAGEFSFLNVNMHNWTGMEDFCAAQCSTSRLLMAYQAQKGGEPVDGREFFRRAVAGEPEALETLDGFAHAVAIQAYNLTALLDIEKLAIGGGISQQPVLIDRIRAAYDVLIDTFPAPAALAGFPRPEIVPCYFGSEANQVGAYFSYCNAL